jgi:uncharacterized phage protein (TIGR01671 family)
MREIIFKAKRIDNGEWVFGGWVEFSSKHSYIVSSLFTEKYLDDEDIMLCKAVMHKVKNETVCQYTNLKDKNGVMIFENDIVKWKADDGCVEHTDTVEYCNGYWFGDAYIYDLPYSLTMLCDEGIVAVIGNKFDGEV